MKRLPILAFALIAVSCSQSDVSRPRIGLITSSAEEPARAAVREAMEAAVGGKAELVVAEGSGRPETRASALFEEKIGAMAVDPADGGALGAIIERAKARRVPLVFFGLEPPSRQMRSWDKLFYVGTRREDVGAAQGELLAAAWKASPALDRNKDGALQLVVLASAEDRQAAVLQAEAASKALGAAGVKSVLLAQDFAEAGVEAARKRTAAILSVYGDRIEAFVCHDDDMALGAADALKASGRAKAGKRVPVVGAGFGAAYAGPAEAMLLAMDSGTILGTAIPDADAQGRAVFDLAYALARGFAPWRTGWKITDAKYVWVPCRKLAKGDLQPGPADGKH